MNYIKVAYEILVPDDVFKLQNLEKWSDINGLNL